MQNSKLKEAIDRLVLESLARKTPVYIDTLGTIAIKSVIDRDSKGIATKAKSVLVLYRDECGADLKDMIRPLCEKHGKSVTETYMQWLSVAVIVNNADRIVLELPNVLTLSVDKATLVAQIMPNGELESYLNPMSTIVSSPLAAGSRIADRTARPVEVKPEPIQETETPKVVTPTKKTEKSKTTDTSNKTTASKWLYILVGFVIATALFVVVIYFRGYMNDGNNRVVGQIVAEVQDVVEPIQVIAESVVDSAKVEPIQVIAESVVDSAKVEPMIEPKAEVVIVKKKELLSYLVLGVFDDKANAEAYKATKQKEGYSPRIFDYYDKHCVALSLPNQDLTSPQVRSLQQKFEGAWYYKF